MPTRRTFLIQAAGAATLLSLSGSALAANNAVQQATAVDKSAYRVAGRNVQNVYLSDSIDGASAASGRFVIIELNPDDDGALLTVKKGRPANQSKNDPAKNGPGKVGDKRAVDGRRVPAGIRENGRRTRQHQLRYLQQRQRL